jgi:SAM-dependent methyltransferase
LSRQEKYHEQNPVVRFVLGRFFRRLGEVMAGIAPESLLDAGCGEGELLRRGALPAGLSPVCLDVRAEALGEIRGVPRVLGSVTRLPFPDGSFDAAVCLEVLEHLADPSAAVAELGRVARRAMVFSVPYEPWFRLGNLARGKHAATLGNHPEHAQHWNRGTFRAMLERQAREVRVIEAFPWIIAWCRPCRD